MAEKTFESQIDYSVKIQNFEGPLDLLLHLVKEAKIDIKDIFVSEVTEQFLQYMQGLSSIDMDKASDFLDVASTLLEIKSRMLLPKIEEIFDDEEDPERKLMRQLEEYKLFKEAGEKLKQSETTDRFYKPPERSAGDVRIIYTDFNLEGLINAFSKLLVKVDERQRDTDAPKEIPKDAFTVSEKIAFIRTIILERKKVSFFELFSKYLTRGEVIVTFQALLELLKWQYIKVRQSGTYEDIDILLREDRAEEFESEITLGET